MDTKTKILLIPILQQKGFSVILSDMCPLVSGISTRDAALSAELGMKALDLAVGGAALAPTHDTTEEEIQSDSSSCSAEDNGVLKPGGHLIIKLLESEDNKGRDFLTEPYLVFGTLSKFLTLGHVLYRIQPDLQTSF